jgi:uracil-DNA glycosylase
MLQDLLSEKSWKQALSQEFQKEYISNLYQFLISEYTKSTIYPSWDNIFLALNLCPLNKIKVVIIGQDPYHNPNQATGLAFSVPSYSKKPPSLNNIFKEIENDLGVTPNNNGDLTRWARQGVLLLNTTLTVRENQPSSHQNQGWEILTDSIIKLISEQKYNIVFILWGKQAQTKKILIASNKHLILESNHPSPLSAYRGFFGSRHFSKTNLYLAKNNIQDINWS